MLRRGLVLAVLLACFCGNAEARTIYTIAGGGALAPPELGEPPLAATAIALPSTGITALPNGRFLIGTRLLLDERGMVRAVPAPRGPLVIGTDRFGTEYFFFSEAPPGLVLRRPGGTYERFAPLLSATNMLVHPDGGVLVTDNRAVVRYMPDGTIIRVAGTGARGYSGDGGPANQARLRSPTDLAWTADGGLLIADRDNSRVRRVSPLDATISTVAGSGERGFGGDGGLAIAAPLRPTKVVVGPHGGFAIVEDGFPRPHIRRVSKSGRIHTVAGGGPPRSFGRGTSILNGDGGHARKGALDSPRGVHITPRDEYVFADDNLVRLITSPRTTRLALALRTMIPSRRRVSYSLSVPARLRLVVRGEGRRVVRLTRARAGLGYFRLPAGLPPGGYTVTLTATASDGGLAVREAAVITTPRLSRRVATAAMHTHEEERPLITLRGLDTTLQHSLLGRATRCHRFSSHRIDCRLEDKISQDCGVQSAQLDQRGQIYIGYYNCTPRGFQPRPVRPLRRWLREPVLMLGPGPFDL